MDFSGRVQLFAGGSARAVPGAAPDLRLVPTKGGIKAKRQGTATTRKEKGQSNRRYSRGPSPDRAHVLGCHAGTRRQEGASEQASDWAKERLTEGLLQA